MAYYKHPTAVVESDSIGDETKNMVLCTYKRKGKNRQRLRYREECIY